MEENSKRWKSQNIWGQIILLLLICPSIRASMPCQELTCKQTPWQCPTCVLSAGQSWGSSSEGWMQLQPAQIALGAILGDNEPLTNDHICPSTESWTKVVMPKVTNMVLGCPILENLHELFTPAEFWPLHHLFLHRLHVSLFGCFSPEQRRLSNLSWITLKRQSATFLAKSKILCSSTFVNLSQTLLKIKSRFEQTALSLHLSRPSLLPSSS